MAGVRVVVEVCGLYDHGYEGRKWTFEKKIPGGSFCRVRLDRSLAMADWCLRFLQVRVSHHTAAASDHEPIHLHGRSKWDESNDSKIINSALLCQPFIILRLIQSQYLEICHQAICTLFFITHHVGSLQHFTCYSKGLHPESSLCQKSFLETRLKPLWM